MEPRVYRLKHEGRVRAMVCRCGSRGFSVARFIGPSGQVKYPWYCTTCNHLTTMYEPKHDHLVFTAVFDGSMENQCEVCRKMGAEWHHWAPTAIFEDEADKWPQSLLCQVCHAKWHGMVTPGLGVEA